MPLPRLLLILGWLFLGATSAFVTWRSAGVERELARMREQCVCPTNPHPNPESVP